VHPTLLALLVCVLSYNDVLSYIYDYKEFETDMIYFPEMH